MKAFFYLSALITMVVEVDGSNSSEGKMLLIQLLTKNESDDKNELDRIINSKSNQTVDTHVEQNPKKIYMNLSSHKYRRTTSDSETSTPTSELVTKKKIHFIHWYTTQTALPQYTQKINYSKIKNNSTHKHELDDILDSTPNQKIDNSMHVEQNLTTKENSLSTQTYTIKLEIEINAKEETPSSLEAHSGYTQKKIHVIHWQTTKKSKHYTQKNYSKISDKSNYKHELDSTPNQKDDNPTRKENKSSTHKYTFEIQTEINAKEETPSSIEAHTGYTQKKIHVIHWHTTEKKQFTRRLKNQKRL